MRTRAEKAVYRTRLLASLAISLSLVIAAIHVPLEKNTPRVGWRARPASHRMYFQVIPDFFETIGIAELPPATRIDTEQPPVVEEKPEPLGAIEARRQIPASADLSAIRGLDANTILEFAEELPEVKGGMGALYLNIDYPEAARQAGIEGRVVLRFVVERNGRVEQVDVLESLHPLCDSAAVRAVRRTVFVPGRQNGHRVRVRMSLPIRFRLVEPGTLRNRVATRLPD